MAAHLTPRRSRWTWPVSLGGAVLVLFLLFLVPAAWWRRLLPEPRLRDVRQRAFVAHLQVVELAAVEPPPAVVAARDDRPSGPDVPFQDAAWWQQAWHGRLERDLRPVAERPDSLRIRSVLALLEARAELATILAAPDSAVEALLWRLAQTEQLSRNDLDGLYAAIARARAYADLKSREAAMYGDFSQETVPITK